jgi:hypothetical protein
MAFSVQRKNAQERNRSMNTSFGLRPLFVLAALVPLLLMAWIVMAVWLALRSALYIRAHRKAVTTAGTIGQRRFYTTCVGISQWTQTLPLG